MYLICTRAGSASAFRLPQNSAFFDPSAFRLPLPLFALFRPLPQKYTPNDDIIFEEIYFQSDVKNGRNLVTCLPKFSKFSPAALKKEENWCLVFQNFRLRHLKRKKSSGLVFLNSQNFRPRCGKTKKHCRISKDLHGLSLIHRNPSLSILVFWTDIMGFLKFCHKQFSVNFWSTNPWISRPTCS